MFLASPCPSTTGTGERLVDCEFCLSGLPLGLGLETQLGTLELNSLFMLPSSRLGHCFWQKDTSVPLAGSIGEDGVGGELDAQIIRLKFW